MGWDLALMGLTVHLSSGQAVDPQESAAWTASDEGTRFMSLSSQRWCAANVASGTNKTDAHAAAARMTAAYTASDRTASDRTADS